MSNHHKFKNSSSIEHCDFHPEKGLEIKFASGTTYHYPDCTMEHYEALKNAESPGKHFHSTLRSMKAKKVEG